MRESANRDFTPLELVRTEAESLPGKIASANRDFNHKRKIDTCI